MNVQKAANDYVNRGWSVIPIGADKRPDFNKLPFNEYGERSWNVYNSRQPTEEELNVWFKLNPSPGIGIVTGTISKLIVVDLDSKGMYNQALAVAPVLRNTLTVKTGKGFHCYLHVLSSKYDTITFKKDGILNHVKGDGGYVVAPPTVHPNGNSYEWTSSRPILSISSIDVLVNLLKQGGFEFKGSGGGITRPEDWYEELFSTTYTVGERMYAAQSLTGLLRHYLTNRPGITYHVLDLWNKEHCDPPLSKREIDNIIKSYYNLYEE